MTAIATRDHPQPTEVPGIAHVGEGIREGQEYAVTFTLYLDADDAEQAGRRAMRFRNAIGCPPLESSTDEVLWGLDFWWHLHDHDAC